MTITDTPPASQATPEAAAQLAGALAPDQGFGASALRRLGPVHAAVRAVWRRLKRLWAVVRPVLTTVQPLGWAALVGVVGGAVACWLWGWREMLVLACVAGGALVVAAVSALGKAHYAVQLDLRSVRVVVGERATGRLVIRNAASRRLLPATMELPVGVSVASFPIPSLAGGAEHDESFVIPTQRRAVIPVGPARSVRGDAIGLIRRVVRWTDEQVLYVHPRTVAVPGAAPGFLKDLEGQATRELSNDDVSFHALRGYVPGDDRRYIHWKTSARSLAMPAQSLMVRQFEETRRSHLAITVSTQAADYASDEEFELAVATAASLGVQAFREERQVSVGASGQVLGTQTMRRMMDAFSGVELSDEAGSIVEAAREMAAYAPSVSVAFLICGSRPSANELRVAARSFPLGVRVVVVRAVAGEPVALKRIGDTAVVTVGLLELLPRALRLAVRLT